MTMTQNGIQKTKREFYEIRIDLKSEELFCGDSNITKQLLALVLGKEELKEKNKNTEHF